MKAKSKISASLVLLMLCAGCGAAVAGGAAGGAGGAVASAKDEGHGPGTYAATILSDIVYFPAKVLFAAGGAIATPITYAVTGGDRQTSSRVWNASVGGDYLVTPDMIAGREPVHFVGPNQTARARLSSPDDLEQER